MTGLIDFGAMAIESVAADLARLLGDWVGPDTNARAEALDAYASVRPLEAAEIALLDVFEDSSALLGAGHWVRWHFLEGRRFDDPSSVAGGIERGLQRLAWRAVAWEGVGRGVDLQPRATLVRPVRQAGEGPCPLGGSQRRQVVPVCAVVPLCSSDSQGVCNASSSVGKISISKGSCVLSRNAITGGATLQKRIVPFDRTRCWARARNMTTAPRESDATWSKRTIMRSMPGSARMSSSSTRTALKTDSSLISATRSMTTATSSTIW